MRFDWRAEIAGCPDGRITFAVRGAAASSFLRNRIGLCVLHPADECAGRPCIVETIDGDRAESVFPALVAPQQPFRNVRAILHEVSPGVEVEVRMEGEAFETEDQGNWGDASYKTYGTPLHLPHPVPLKSGASVEQSVAVRLFGITAEPVEQATATVPGALPHKRNSPEPVVVTLGAGASGRFRRIGLAGAELAALAEADAARLRPLRLAHVRADLHLERDAWGAALERAAANARLLDVPLEIALFLPDDPHDALRELAAKAAALGPRVATLARLPGRRPDDGGRPGGDGARGARGGRPRGRCSAEARTRTSSSSTAAARCRGCSTGWSSRSVRRCTPLDDATLVENLGSLRRIAETLRSFADRTPLGISPVTLRPRVDPSPAAWRKRGERPVHGRPAAGHGLRRRVDARLPGGGGRGGLREPDPLRAHGPARRPGVGAGVPRARRARRRRGAPGRQGRARAHATAGAGPGAGAALERGQHAPVPGQRHGRDPPGSRGGLSGRVVRCEPRAGATGRGLGARSWSFGRTRS